MYKLKVFFDLIITHLFKLRKICNIMVNLFLKLEKILYGVREEILTIYN